MRLPHLTSLQGGRAIAALMVVFYHLNIFILPKRLYAETGEALHPVANMGYSGVEFFFALSGFLMLYIHRRDFGAPQKAYSYAIKRVSRIYPAYWLVLIPMVLAGALIPAVGLGYMPGLGQLLPNLFLVPMEDTPILQVSWTLQHEMLFYAIFGLAILHRWIGLGILSMWFTACALTVFSQDVLFPADFLFSPYNLIFLFGGLAAVSFQHLGRNAARGLLVGGLLVFLMTGLNDIYRPVEIGFGVRTVLFGASRRNGNRWPPEHSAQPSFGRRRVLHALSCAHANDDRRCAGCEIPAPTGIPAALDHGAAVRDRVHNRVRCRAPIPGTPSGSLHLA